MLARRPLRRTVVVAVRAPCCEIQGREVAQVLTDESQHLVILGREVLEAVTDRRSTRPQSDEWRFDGAKFLLRLSHRQPPLPTPSSPGCSRNASRTGGRRTTSAPQPCPAQGRYQPHRRQGQPGDVQQPRELFLRVRCSSSPAGPGVLPPQSSPWDRPTGDGPSCGRRSYRTRSPTRPAPHGDWPSPTARASRPDVPDPPSGHGKEREHTGPHRPSRTAWSSPQCSPRSCTVPRAPQGPETSSHGSTDRRYAGAHRLLPPIP